MQVLQGGFVAVKHGVVSFVGGGDSGSEGQFWGTAVECFVFVLQFFFWRLRLGGARRLAVCLLALCGPSVHMIACTHSV
jgi:hypothetical protein